MIINKLLSGLIAITLSFSLTGCGNDTQENKTDNIIEATPLVTVESTIVPTPLVNQLTEQVNTVFDISSIPPYSGTPYVDVNNNIPYFTSSDLTTTAFENYSSLDNLGRCGVAYANICKEIMPTEERGKIGQVKPTGWHTVKYDNVDGKYLYNRCHLIGYQLSGENANEKNLITGTRYMNVDGMLPFENMVADYVKETNNHVLYRVTPIFEGSNLLANGVLMEAKSVEDNGDGILFNVFCYNVQPGITINYATGDSSENQAINESGNDSESVPVVNSSTDSNGTTDISNNVQTYVLNTNTKKFHYPTCSSVSRMSEKNKQTVSESRDDIISQGYSPCGNCNP